MIITFLVKEAKNIYMSEAQRNNSYTKNIGAFAGIWKSYSLRLANTFDRPQLIPILTLPAFPTGNGITMNRIFILDTL